VSATVQIVLRRIADAGTNSYGPMIPYRTVV
jgi:hypothetical protein